MRPDQAIRHWRTDCNRSGAQPGRRGSMQCMQVPHRTQTSGMLVSNLPTLPHLGTCRVHELMTRAAIASALPAIRAACQCTTGQEQPKQCRVLRRRASVTSTHPCPPEPLRPPAPCSAGSRPKPSRPSSSRLASWPSKSYSAPLAGTAILTRQNVRICARLRNNGGTRAVRRPPPAPRSPRILQSCCKTR